MSNTLKLSPMDKGHEQPDCTGSQFARDLVHMQQSIVEEGCKMSANGLHTSGGGGGAAPPVSEIFGQNAQNSGNKETIKDGIKKYINKAKI